MVLRLCIIFALLVLGCSNPYERDNPLDPSFISCSDPNYFCDTRDSLIYRVVTIGTQTWMGENMNYGSNEEDCYDKNSMNCNKYGRLYTMSQLRYVCPDGWHVPSQAEWNVLGSNAKKLKATSWNGTDDYGFSAVPGGSTGWQGTGWAGRGKSSGWWSNGTGTSGFYTYAYIRIMDNSDTAKWDDLQISAYFGSGASVTLNENAKYSVRCIKDANVSSSSSSFHPSSSSSTPSSSSNRSSSSSLPTSSSSSLTQSSSSGTFEDGRDGQTYKLVKIGTQTWFAQNLNYNATGSKCYNNSTSNCTKYGRLYNWATAMTACPEDYHLPTQAEWNALGDDSRKLKATTGWDGGGNGTNDYGFNAMPGGYGDSSGDFDGIGESGFWWSSSGEGNNAYNRDIYSGSNTAVWDYDNKSFLVSVRCIKDNN